VAYALDEKRAAAKRHCRHFDYQGLNSSRAGTIQVFDLVVSCQLAVPFGRADTFDLLQHARFECVIRLAAGTSRLRVRGSIPVGPANKINSLRQTRFLEVPISDRFSFCLGLV
jgi:hypothetical protein